MRALEVWDLASRSPQLCFFSRGGRLWTPLGHLAAVVWVDVNLLAPEGASFTSELQDWLLGLEVVDAGDERSGRGVLSPLDR